MCACSLVVRIPFSGWGTWVQIPVTTHVVFSHIMHFTFQPPYLNFPVLPLWSFYMPINFPALFRIIRSVVADSDTTTDVTTTTLATVDGSSKRRRVSADWANLITGVGQVFESPKAFRDTLHKYAVANKFT